MVALSSLELLKLQGRKTYKISLQMDLKTIPMDSKHTKTPRWAFSTPHLAKK
jgi:hypothetical protein